MAVTTKIEGNLDQLKNTVRSKTDGIPYLLFPVRLETRFMNTYKKPHEYTDQLSELLHNIIALDDLFKIPASTMKSNAFVLLFQNLDRSIKALSRSHIQPLKDILPLERSWVRDELLDIQKKAVSYKRTFDKRRFAARQKLVVDRAYKSMAITFQKAQALLLGISIKVDDTYLPATSIVNELTKLNTRAKTIIGPELPHKNKGKRKKLIVFLTSALKAFNDFYNRDLDYYDTVVDVEKSQLKRLNELHRSLVQNINKISRRLPAIHEDDHWKAFSKSYAKVWIAPLKERFTFFENEVLKRFGTMSELRKIPINNVVYEGLKTLKYIKQVNNRKDLKFKDYKALNKKVISQMKSLALSGQQPISGSLKAVAHLEEIKTKIDKETVGYKRRIKKIKTQNSGQKHSIKNAVERIDLLRKTKLKTLTGITSGELTHISPADFNHSTIVHANTMTQLNDVIVKLEKVNKPNSRVSLKRKKELLKNVSSIHKTLLKTKHRNVVLTPELKMQWENQIKRTGEALKTTGSIALGRERFEIADKGKELLDLIKNKDLALATGARDLSEEFLDNITIVPRRLPVKELWVRIYPDDVALHSHEKALTEEEITSGKDFWKELWIASGDKDLRLGAWRALCEIHGVERATYIAQVLDPKNLGGNNEVKFLEFPDQDLIDATTALTDVVKMLSKIHLRDTPQVLLNKTARKPIKQQLSLALSFLKKESQVHEYLYFKGVDQARKIQSFFTIVFEAIGNVDTLEKQKLRSRFASPFSLFGEIQEVLAQLEVLSPSDFFDKTTVSFAYPNVSKKDEDWTEAPHTKVMPDRFVLITRKGALTTHIKLGNKLLSDKLQVGLDPKKFDMEDLYKYTENGDMEVDPDIKWLTDYHTARIQGMGISLELTSQEFSEGFDELIVLGIKDDSAANNQKLLEDLLENHQYTSGGMELIPLGTPTNNTEESKSGYASHNTNFEETLELGLGNLRYADNGTDKSKDGQILTDALGIENKTLIRVKGSDKEEMIRPQIFNKAMFPATLGYHLYEMMNGLFMQKDVDDIADFFEAHVSARGSLPSIRIDSQPYGILTTTAFSKFQSNGDAFHKNLTGMLKLLNREWSEIRKFNVAHNGNIVGDPQEHFMEMLGLQAYSTDYFSRFGANTFMSYPKEDFPQQYISDPSVLASVFKDFLNTDDLVGYAINDARILKLTRSRIFSTTFFKEHTAFTGIRTQEQELSVKDALIPNGDKNYIQWLLDNDLYAILANNEVQNFPSQSLLYMMLRQALLWTYSRASLEILKRENVISDFDRFNIGGEGFLRVPLTNFNLVEEEGLDVLATKWSFLFRSLNKLNSGANRPVTGPSPMSETTFYKYLIPGNSTQNLEDRSMAAYLNPINKALFQGFSGHNSHQTALSRVNQLRRALSDIALWPSKELDRLTAEHLDLCSYRLDGWLLGLAKERLNQQRKTNKKGIHLGCYGYLEDLRPGGARTPINQNNIPTALQTEDSTAIYTDEDNQGHIHMPSINHAITAAVLRAGYIANKQESGDIENQMAVNLSSARVRKALQVIAGVRNGQEVGAVLGYQLERGLHDRYTDAEMDRFIYPLRKRFPLQPEIQITENDSNYNANVIHGNDLLEFIDDHLEGAGHTGNKSLYETLVASNFSLCPQLLKDIITKNGGTNKELRVLLQEIDRIADAFDALADLALSESVYQIVQGNHVRAGAVLAALGKGRTMPEPEIVSTPRSGTVVTQRVVLGLKPTHAQLISASTGISPAQLQANQNAAKPIGWTGVMTPRAIAEPGLNHFYGSILGPADTIKCDVLINKEGGDVLTTVSMADLVLQPIDLVLLLGNGEDGGSEITKRIAFFVRATQNPQLELDVPLEIKIQAKGDHWLKTDQSIFEIMPKIRGLQKLTDNLRPATFEEVSLPLQTAENKSDRKLQDISELEIRAQEAESVLNKIITDLNAFFDSLAGIIEDLDAATFSPIEINTMRKLLFDIADIGEAYAIPDSAIETTNEVGQDLARQLLVRSASLHSKQEKIAKHRQALLEEKDNSAKVSKLITIIKTVFGKSFTVVPHFILQNKVELKTITDFPEDKGLLRNDPEILDDWLSGVGRVREKMYEWEMLGMLQEVNDKSFPVATVAQLPYVPQSAETVADYWLGAPYPSSYSSEGDKLSLVIYGEEHLFGLGAQAALILDEWLEIIPNTKETTGLAFNYDQPNATPPQSLLLAVTPKVTGKWEWDDLVDTVIDTMTLAKNRAVEPDHLEKSKFAAILPAISSEVYPPNMTFEEHLMHPKTQVPLDILGLNK